jgi:outer membrane protein assembly factor BamB
MKLKPLFFTISILLLASLLSACTGGAGIATSWPGLAVDEDTAYLAFNTQVYAINISNGSEKWRYPAEPNNQVSFYANPAISPDGQLIVGGYNNVLYSLNPENGQLNWEFTGAQRKYVAGPLAVEQGIFAPNADMALYALGVDGSLRWSFKTEGENWAQPTTDPACQCIYLTSMDHRVYALEPADGSLLWKTDDLGGAIVGTPTLSDEGILYIGTFGSKLLALDSRNGSIIWESPTEGWIWSGPALSGGRLYVGDLDGNFYAFNAADGQEIWRLNSDQLDGSISGTPLVIEDRIYVTSELGTLYTLDTSGKEFLPPQTFEGKLYSAPVLAGDKILVTSNQADQFLVAISLDGARQWSFPPPDTD